jgi:cytochrome c biogenesis protein CcdA
MGAVLLSFAAGALSLLSPCVLPLLPVALAGALDRHRLGAVALAGGLALSATGFGLSAALLGTALDRDAVRLVAAALLVVVGAVLLMPALEEIFARAARPIAGGAATLLQRLDGSRGLAAQVLAGALLGVLWIPCGGPTLASAIGLAAQRESLAAAAVVMAAYSAGAAVPLLAVAYGSRRTLCTPPRLAAIARVGKPAMGMALVLMGALTLAGADKVLEGHLVDLMPAWLVDLTTAL